MTTLEERITILEETSVTEHQLSQSTLGGMAVLKALVDKIDANHESVMRRIDSAEAEMKSKHADTMQWFLILQAEMNARHADVIQRIEGLQREMNFKHDAVMRELGRMESGGALN